MGRDGAAALVLRKRLSSSGKSRRWEAAGGGGRQGETSVRRWGGGAGGGGETAGGGETSGLPVWSLLWPSSPGGWYISRPEERAVSPAGSQLCRSISLKCGSLPPSHRPFCPAPRHSERPLLPGTTSTDSTEGASLMAAILGPTYVTAGPLRVC